MIAVYLRWATRMSEKYGTRLERSPEPVQRLAALVYDEFGGRVSEAAKQVKPGSLFLLAIGKPALADLRDALEQRVAPRHWPAPSARNIEESGPLFWSLLQGALSFTDDLAIDDGGTVVHATALVMQTVASRAPWRRRNNERQLRGVLLDEARGALQAKPAARVIQPEPVREADPVAVREPAAPQQKPFGLEDAFREAHQRSALQAEPAAPVIQPEPVREAEPVAAREPAAPQQKPFSLEDAFRGAHQRNDESPGVHRVSRSGMLEVRLATHRGPSYANLGENQDAATANAGEGLIVFALADGVTTSYGSRFSAWTAVQAAVAHLMANVALDGDESAMRDVLRDAAVAARLLVSDCLTYALANLDEETWSTIRGAQELPLANARLFLENTLSRKMPSIGPAFASTLVAGVVTEPRGDRPARASIIRVGDGTAEIWRAADSSAHTLYAVDNAETVISAAICPGPVGEQSIAQAQFAFAELAPGDDLIASSDGLTRGHSELVVTTLRDTIPAAFSKFDQRRSALEILTAAAAAADEQQRDRCDRRLFEDNLALVRITVRRR